MDKIQLVMALVFAIAIVAVGYHQRKLNRAYKAARDNLLKAKMLTEASRTAKIAMELLCSIEKQMAIVGEEVAIERLRKHQALINESLLTIVACDDMPSYELNRKALEQTKEFIDRYLSNYKG